jgi:hypothetical protein
MIMLSALSRADPLQTINALAARGPSGRSEAPRGVVAAISVDLGKIW